MSGGEERRSPRRGHCPPLKHEPARPTRYCSRDNFVVRQRRDREAFELLPERGEDVPLFAPPGEDAIENGGELQAFQFSVQRVDVSGRRTAGCQLEEVRSHVLFTNSVSADEL